MRRAAAACLLMLAPALLSPTFAGAADTGDAVARGLGTLREAQKDDGSIGGLDTPWAILAAVAAGEDPDAWRPRPDGPSLLDALADQYLDQGTTTATDWERGILAIAAAGEDPSDFRGRDWLGHLQALHVGDQTGNAFLLNDDIFGILALRAAGVPASDEQVRDSLAHLLDHQRADGAWSDRTSASAPPSVDLTGMALCALAEAGVNRQSRVVQRTLAYLDAKQQADGGFPYPDTAREGSVYATAYVLHGLHCAGEDPRDARWRPAGKDPVNFLRERADFGHVWQAREAVRALTHPGFPVRPDGSAPAVPEVPPAAVLHASADTTHRNATVELDARASADPDGGALAFRWDLGDGTRLDWGAAPVVTHRYATLGDHEVVVQVRDDEGHITTATRMVRVENRAPTLSAPDALEATRVDAPAWHLVRAEDPDGDDLAWHWRFGDGNATADPQPAHRYAGLGNHTVHVTVVDAHGAATDARFRVRVVNLPPHLRVTGPTHLAVGETGHFNPTATDPDGPAPRIEWLTGAPEIRFDEAGRHEVRVAAEDADGTRVERRLTVHVTNASTNATPQEAPPPRVGELGASPPDPAAYAPFEVHATPPENASVAAVTFSWPGGRERVTAPPWNATVPGLPPGEHEILAVAEDASGARTGGSLALRVASPAPSDPDDREPGGDAGAFGDSVNLTVPRRVHAGDPVQVRVHAPSNAPVEAWTSTGLSWEGVGNVSAVFVPAREGPVRVWARTGDAPAISRLVQVDASRPPAAPTNDTVGNASDGPPAEAVDALRKAPAPGVLLTLAGALALPWARRRRHG